MGQRPTATPEHASMQLWEDARVAEELKQQVCLRQLFRQLDADCKEQEEGMKNRW